MIDHCVCIERLLIALLNYHNRRCVCVGRLFISFHLQVSSSSRYLSLSLHLCERLLYSLLYLFLCLFFSFEFLAWFIVRIIYPNICTLVYCLIEKLFFIENECFQMNFYAHMRAKANTHT